MSPNNGVTESTTELYNDEPEIPPKELSFKEKMILLKNNITIEPYFLAILIPPLFAGVTVYFMHIQMACNVNLGYNITICKNPRQVGGLIQQIFSELEAWKSPLLASIAVITALLFGSYSDRYKIRKPFFILPVVGEILSGIGMIVCFSYIQQWPLEVIAFFSSILPALFGGAGVEKIAIYSYMSDISSKELRTLKIGILQIFGMVIAPICVLLNGVLQKPIGHYGIFGLCLASLLFALFYAVFFIKETQKPIVREKNLCLDLFDPRDILSDLWKTATKKREGNKRALLILLFIANILITGPTGQESSKARQYMQARFQWDNKYLGYIIAYDMAIDTIGAMLFVIIFVKKLQINDLLLAAIACFAKIIGGVWYAYSNTSTLFYLGSVVSMFSTGHQLALRSYASKLVNMDEIAKSQALFSICDALGPIVYSNIYNEFFKATKDSFFSAFYLFGSALLIPALFLILIMYIVERKDYEKHETKENDIVQETYKTSNIEMSKL